MKAKAKKQIALILVLVMCIGLVPTHTFAADASNTSEQVEISQQDNAVQVSQEESSESEVGDEDLDQANTPTPKINKQADEPATFSLWPASSKLSFDEEHYTGSVGETVYLTGIYVCEKQPTDFTWECSTENAVTFSATSVEGPSVTKKENTYWISTAATTVKEGTYTVTLTVKADSAKKAEATTEVTVTKAISSRYTVLILDTSGSMSGTPASVQKDAAIKFCKAITSASGTNRVAIVKLNSSSSEACGFTTDLDTLTAQINQMPASGGTNIDQALTVSQGLLDQVENSSGLTKNIVLCSDGLPESGGTSTDGPYSSSDHSYYAYGNAVSNTSKTIKESGIDIYTLGFFHSLSGSDLTFGRRLMSDIATSANYYYEVTDVNDLEFKFGEIVGDITVDPISIEVSSSTYSGMTNGVIQYQIRAKITNNSKTAELTDVFVQLDEGDHAEIVEEHGEWQQSVDNLGAEQSKEFTWVIELKKSDYADGGTHSFIVYAGSDQTVTSSVKGSIAVAATNGESNELDFWTDVWNFHNYEDNQSAIDILTEDDRNALLTNLSPSECEEILSLAATPHGGHCFGMSLTAILSKMNIFDVANYSKASCLRDADKTERIESILCYYHQLQVLNSFISDMQNFLLKVDREQLIMLAEKADAVKNGGSPVLFSFGCEGWGAHAVVAYATESGSWIYDGITYNKRVYIYDCNAANGKSKWFGVNPVWNPECCLYFNEGTDQWIIPVYKTYVDENTKETLPGMISTNEKAYLEGACNDLNVLNTHNYDSSLYNFIAELRCENETAMRLKNGNNQYIIMGKSGSVTGDTKLATYYDSNTISNKSNIGTLHVILPDEKEKYTLSTLSGKAEALDFHIKDEDLFLSVDAEAAKGSVFALDRTVALRGNQGGYTVKVADDTKAKGEFNTYTFSGKNSGDISFKVADDGVLITGDDLSDITVKASDGEKTEKIMVDSDKGNILVTEKHGHLSAQNGQSGSGYKAQMITDAFVTLSEVSVPYTGKAQTPAVSVKNGSVSLSQETDYELSYEDNLNAGTAKVTVTGIGRYTGTVTKTFQITSVNQTITAKSFSKTLSKKTFRLGAKTNGDGKLTYKSSNTKVATVSGSGKITLKGVGRAKIVITAAATQNYQKVVKTIVITVNPTGTKLSSVKNIRGKKMMVKWKRNTKVSGYQIQYSTSSKFKNAKKVTVKPNKITKKMVSKLVKKKKYYVRIRTYRKISGKTYYSSWSGSKSVIIKK